MKKNILKTGLISVIIIFLLGLNVKVSFVENSGPPKINILTTGQIAYAYVDELSYWCFNNYTSNISGDIGMSCSTCNWELGSHWTAIGKCTKTPPNTPVEY